MEEVYATIVGGGVLGTALAYELSKRTDREVIVLERHKKSKLENQSLRSSGVDHAGVYYPKDTAPLKSRLCVEGNPLVYDFCNEYGIPNEMTGKLVVATNELEVPYVQDVLRNAIENGVPDARMIDGDEARAMEPNVKCLKAAYFPTSGILDAAQYLSTLRAVGQEQGTEFMFGTKVVGINSKNDEFEITTQTDGSNIKDKFKTELLFNCAGLYSDEIAKMVNSENDWEIFPTRGEAAMFYKSRRPDLDMGRMNVYPATFGFFNETGEKAEIPFEEYQKLLKEGKVTRMVGVHLSPTFGLDGKIGNTVMVGPGVTIGFGKENYQHHLPMDFFAEEVKGFAGQLKTEDLGEYNVGIQAKLKTHFDWVIERDQRYPNCVHNVGIDSPGITGSLAIAKYSLEELLGLN